MPCRPWPSRQRRREACPRALPAGGQRLSRLPCCRRPWALCCACWAMLRGLPFSGDARVAEATMSSGAFRSGASVLPRWWCLARRRLRRAARRHRRFAGAAPASAAAAAPVSTAVFAAVFFARSSLRLFRGATGRFGSRSNSVFAARDAMHGLGRRRGCARDVVRVRAVLRWRGLAQRHRASKRSSTSCMIRPCAACGGGLVTGRARGGAPATVWRGTGHGTCRAACAPAAPCRTARRRQDLDGFGAALVEQFEFGAVSRGRAWSGCRPSVGLL